MICFGGILFERLFEGLFGGFFRGSSRHFQEFSGELSVRYLKGQFGDSARRGRQGTKEEEYEEEERQRVCGERKKRGSKCLFRTLGFDFRFLDTLLQIQSHNIECEFRFFGALMSCPGALSGVLAIESILK